MFSAPFAFAAMTQVPALLIIPTPQSVTLTGGGVDVRAGVQLELAEGASAEDRFAKADFEAEFPPGRHRVLVGRIGRDREVDEALSRIGLQPPAGKLRGAYALSVSRDLSIAAGMDAAGTFYALQTLKQVLRANVRGGSAPALTIIDWPELEYRAWQDDISRGPIPTLEYLKREIRTLAEYKLNAFTLYTEHVFRLTKHPKISPLDGITAAEVRELCEYGRNYHVEVIGNFQSFGHFEHILKVPEYAHLGESGWVLSPAKEESYKFLRDVYDEIAPSYSSALFNINCDETGGLGTGASRKLVEQVGIGEVYARHINRVCDLLRAHGKTAMMWGDIALAHREIVPKLPKDLIVLSWAYHAADRWDGMITPFTELGLKFWVCPGVSCWGQIFPDFDTATANISNFVRDGARNGAQGVNNTTWDDSGENFFNNNWYPLVWGANVSWKPAIPKDMDDRDEERAKRLDAFDKCFVPLFFGSSDALKVSALWRLSRLRENPASFGLADRRSWGQPPPDTGVHARALLKEAERIESELTSLRKSAKRNADTLDAPLFAVRRVKGLAERTILAERLGKWAETGDGGGTLAADCRRVAALWRELGEQYGSVWDAESRPWWLDRNLPKYATLAAEIGGLQESPIFAPSRREFSGSMSVELKTLIPDQEVRYTLNGSEPKSDSALFSRAIVLDKTTRIRARTFRGGQPVGSVSDTTFYTTTLPCRFETSMPTYEEHRPLFAFDGTIDKFFWSAGSPKSGSTFTVIFDRSESISSIKAITGHPNHPADYVQAGVLEVSEDGRTFRQVAQFGGEVAEATLGPGSIRAIRIRVTKDSNNWLVIREIEVKR